MGTYIYTIKRSGRKTVEFEGKAVKAANLAYLYKPVVYAGWQDAKRANAPFEAAITRTEKAWAADHPGLVVVGDWEEGATVLGSWPKDKVVWADTEALPGVTVGHLVRKGRGWRVVPSPTF